MDYQLIKFFSKLPRFFNAGNWPNLLTLDANGGTIENENTMTYDAATPMGSGGYVYLCAYPIPVREGYTFTGDYTSCRMG